MEITKREIIVSVAILFIMTSLAIMFTFMALDNHNNESEKYHKALQLENPEEIEFGMNTDVGYAFISIQLKSNERVTNPKLKGEYLYIFERVEEYVMKTRIVTSSNGNGGTTTRTETYWEWDVVARNETSVEYISLNDIVMPYDMISVPPDNLTLTSENNNHSDNISWGGSYLEFPAEFFGNNRTRISYNVLEANGTYSAFVDLRDNTINPSSNKYILLREISVDEHYKMMVAAPIGWYVLIWILWFFITAGLILGFYYFDNHWLNRDKGE